MSSKIVGGMRSNTYWRLAASFMAGITTLTRAGVLRPTTLMVPGVPDSWSERHSVVGRAGAAIGLAAGLTVLTGFDGDEDVVTVDPS
jgi:hypothetical protein